jgi:hypothetical protein
MRSIQAEKARPQHAAIRCFYAMSRRFLNRVRWLDSGRGHFRGLGIRRRGGEAAPPPSRHRKRCRRACACSIQSLASHDASVRRVSLADKLYNARAILLDYRRLGDELWERFDPEADQLWYHRALALPFRETTESPLVEELDRVVTELEQAVRTVKR